MSNSVYSTIGQGTSAADLQADLAASVADRNTVATVVVGPSTTAGSNVASTNAVNPHIYTGQATDFVGSPSDDRPNGRPGDHLQPRAV